MANLDDTDVGAAAQDLYSEYRARKERPNDQIEQDLRGPREHKQFMHETTAQNPIVGTAAMAVAPAYSAAKKVTAVGGFVAAMAKRASGAAADDIGMKTGGTGETKTSRASLDEVFAAGEGYVKGLKQYFKGKFK
jgi:hypothetical protein